MRSGEANCLESGVEMTVSGLVAGFPGNQRLEKCLRTVKDAGRRRIADKGRLRCFTVDLSRYKLLQLPDIVVVNARCFKPLRSAEQVFRP